MKLDDADITEAWQSVTLASTELWQVRAGAILWSTEAVEANRLGVIMRDGESYEFPSGATVYYKRYGRAYTTVTREAV